MEVQDYWREVLQAGEMKTISIAAQHTVVALWKETEATAGVSMRYRSMSERKRVLKLSNRKSKF